MRKYLELISYFLWQKYAFMDRIEICALCQEKVILLEKGMHGEEVVSVFEKSRFLTSFSREIFGYAL